MSGEVDKTKGRIKQAAGDLTGDKDLRNDGKKDEAAGTLKDGAEKVKDKFEDAVDSVKKRT